jgi:bifunctional non-homologous end joining protein LigD
MKLKLTHTDKVFWPEEGYTKGDVIAYYANVARYILPHLKDRPESLMRQPGGINDPGFFQKNVAREHLPPFIDRASIYSESNKKDLCWLVCDNKETLLWLANFGCIELNPWQSRTKALTKPDYLTIDLDPQSGAFEDCIPVALGIHELLERAKIPSFPKTSGKRGLHIMIPLGAKYSYAQARKFAELLVAIANARMPALTTLEWRKALRGKKVFLDIARNAKGQTTAAVYSLRPYPGATVSAPLEWKEVKKGLTPSAFTIKTIFKRKATCSRACSARALTLQMLFRILRGSCGDNGKEPCRAPRLGAAGAMS